MRPNCNVEIAKMGETVCREGVVRRISENLIYVAVVQGTACSECHAKAACGLTNGAEKVIKIPTTSKQFEIGEKVRVKARNSTAWKAVWLAFALPLILLLTLFTLSLSLLKEEALAALCSVAALGIYYLVLYSRRGKLERQFVLELEKL